MKRLKKKNNKIRNSKKHQIFHFELQRIDIDINQINTTLFNSQIVIVTQLCFRKFSMIFKDEFNLNTSVAPF